MATATSLNADYKSQLWKMADALRGSMDSAEYKHVVLPLVFLKYISDAFEDTHEELCSKVDEYYDPEDPDEYIGRNVLWVPQDARWAVIQARSRQPDIGVTIDNAIDAIDRDNPILRGTLPKGFAREAIDKVKLGEVVDLVSNINLGSGKTRSVDVLGQVYEYFLEQFAFAEGKHGGEFYTTRCVVNLLVEMIQPSRAASSTPAVAPAACSCSRLISSWVHSTKHF